MPENFALAYFPKFQKQLGTDIETTLFMGNTKDDCKTYIKCRWNVFSSFKYLGKCHSMWFCRMTHNNITQTPTQAFVVYDERAVVALLRYRIHIYNVVSTINGVCIYTLTWWHVVQCIMPEKQKPNDVFIQCMPALVIRWLYCHFSFRFISQHITYCSFAHSFTPHSNLIRSEKIIT